MLKATITYTWGSFDNDPKTREVLDSAPFFDARVVGTIAGMISGGGAVITGLTVEEV